MSWLQNHCLDWKPHKVPSGPLIVIFLCSPTEPTFFFPSSLPLPVDQEERCTWAGPGLTSLQSHLSAFSWALSPRKMGKLASCLLVQQGLFSIHQHVQSCYEVLWENPCTPSSKEPTHFTSIKSGFPSCGVLVKTACSAWTGLESKLSGVWVIMTQQCPAREKSSRKVSHTHKHSNNGCLKYSKN